MRHLAFLLLISGLITPSLAQNDPERYSVHLESGDRFYLETRSDADHFYLEAAPFLQALGWYSKPLSGSLVGLCTNEICVPVDTEIPSQAAVEDGRLFLNLDFVAGVLKLSYQRQPESKVVALSRLENQPQQDVSTGLAFPSANLVKADGSREVVNTMEYLQGKRAIVFCFASW